MQAIFGECQQEEDWAGADLRTTAMIAYRRPRRLGQD
jgi:hypothetical protein